ncbi:hypothetical protein BE21_15400 [Sorangium cellulosum]|uniref:Secreted protein n=1 Tax=Sorangium cellulosum TaxID=56 RepID=A0A150TZH2_SORCE|nr:hypothetical protein BE21_15400 [Sorangium cellulosum]
MNTYRIVNGLGFVCFGVVAIALAGCAVDATDEDALVDDVVDEDLAEAEQASGVECAGAAATAAFVGGINTTSPQSYSTASCYKGVVLDVQSYSSLYAQNPSGSVFPGRTTVEWADGLPTLADPDRIAKCESTYLAADLFEKVGPSWVYKTTKESLGIWTPFFDGGFCAGPGVSFSSEMQAGKTYRISATARTHKSSSAATRKLHVESREPVKAPR